MTLNLRTTRRLLWAATAAAAMGCAAAVAWGLLAPVSVTAGDPTVGSTRPAPAATRPSRVWAPPPLADLQAACRVDLRRPLVDAPAVVPQVAPLAVRLAGTIVEPGRAVAVLVSPQGRTEMRRVGESSGGAEVVSIEEDAVTVRYHGQLVTLRVERKGRG